MPIKMPIKSGGNDPHNPNPPNLPDPGPVTPRPPDLPYLPDFDGPSSPVIPPPEDA